MAASEYKLDAETLEIFPLFEPKSLKSPPVRLCLLEPKSIIERWLLELVPRLAVLALLELFETFLLTFVLRPLLLTLFWKVLAVVSLHLFFLRWRFGSFSNAGT